MWFCIETLPNYSVCGSQAHQIESCTCMRLSMWLDGWFSFKSLQQSNLIRRQGHVLSNDAHLWHVRDCPFSIKKLQNKEPSTGIMFAKQYFPLPPHVLHRYISTYVCMYLSIMERSTNKSIFHTNISFISVLSL